MKRSHIFMLAGGALVLAAGAWLIAGARKSDASQYRFATVERGDLEATVSSTGTLSAVTTVQVGTQVSGKIVAIHADFNDRVKKGQLIAQIDPVLLQQAVRDAQAGVERNQAQLEQTRREYERNKLLFERKVLTEIDFNTAKYNYDVAQANVKSAQVDARACATEPRIHRHLSRPSTVSWWSATWTSGRRWRRASPRRNCS